jgi:hypothetical protein
MRYFFAALGVVLTLASGTAAFAQGNPAWGTASNGYGYYHSEGR